MSQPNHIVVNSTLLTLDITAPPNLGHSRRHMTTQQQRVHAALSLVACTPGGLSQKSPFDSRVSMLRSWFLQIQARVPAFSMHTIAPKDGHEDNQGTPVFPFTDDFCKFRQCYWYAAAAAAATAAATAAANDDDGNNDACSLACKTQLEPQPRTAASLPHPSLFSHLCAAGGTLNVLEPLRKKTGLPAAKPTQN